MADRIEPMPDPALTVIRKAAVVESVARALATRGWWLGHQAVDDDLVEGLSVELAELMEAERLERAGIGRDLDYQVTDRIRTDRIFWLNRRFAFQARFLDQMEALRLTLNHETFLGLFEFEGHFAHYEPGGFYRRHFDSFHGAANRIVSMVAYLNRNWQPGDGGQLVLHAGDGDRPPTLIEPRAGSLLLFLSEEIEHEVLPAIRDRASIAGWFRLNASVNNQIDPAS